MEIKNITYRDGRDFKAIFQCEHCGYEIEEWRYNDKNYHENVIPNMKCPECRKRADRNYHPLAKKYPGWMEV